MGLADDRLSMLSMLVSESSRDSEAAEEAQGHPASQRSNTMRGGGGGGDVRGAGGGKRSRETEDRVKTEREADCRRERPRGERQVSKTRNEEGRDTEDRQAAGSREQDAGHGYER